MNANLHRVQRLALIATLLTSVILSSCNDDSRLTSEKNGAQWVPQTVKVRVEGTDIDQGATTISSLNAYLFVGEKLQKIHIDLKPSQTDTYSLFAVKDCNIYFLANLSSNPELKSLKEGVTDLNTFLALRSQAINDATQPERFLSGKSTITSISDNTPAIQVSLAQSVAQLDLDTSRDQSIKVERIVIDGISASSTLFTSKSPLPPTSTISCDLKYDTAITSKSNILQLYESSTPVEITVYTSYMNTPAVVKLRLGQVKRNYKYSIKLEGSGSNITGSLQITPWIDGGTVGGNPNQTGVIELSNTHSTLPEGALIDEKTQTVSVSEKGGSMTLAVSSDIKAELESTEGDGNNITITPLATESKDGKVITTFEVNVNPQEKGRLGYLATVRMKRAAQQFSYDQFYINVSGSKYQIMDATLGGVTWMAFNATTPNLNEQTYPLDGESVKDVYDNRWPDAIGGLFQWGRLYKYTPWLSGAHNAGKQDHSVPWTKETHVPCPIGYRIPTKDEMRALLPSGQAIPGTYKYNSETITAALHVSKIEHPTNVNNVGGRSRYISLTSSTGEVLYIPLAGKKGDKSSAANPGLGQGLTLWTNSSQGAIGGWSWTGEFWPTLSNSTGTITTNAQFQAEAFASLRCVKK